MRKILDQIVTSALQAVDPRRRLHKLLQLDQSQLSTPAGVLDLKDFRKIWLLSVGKASVPMAMALEDILGSFLDSGQVLTPHGNRGLLFKTRVREAAHPEPDQAGLEATSDILDWLRQSLGPQDLLVLALSGGGSALLAAPLPEISLEEKQRTTRQLLLSGATIHEINAVRKHLSRVKGGRLLDWANGARILTLVISDVVGDEISSIASGPSVADPTTFSDCLDILSRYALEESIPGSVVRLFERGVSRPELETPKPGDPRFGRVQTCLIANNRLALEGAAEQAATLDFPPLILSSSLSGDCESSARNLASVAREVVLYGTPIHPPCCLLSGGECSVRVTGSGRGGRNQHLALAFSQEITGWKHPLLFASLGSDGIDGPTDAAGALVTPQTVTRAVDLGLDPKTYLRNNDSYHFFAALGDLLITGPTQTNVMDLQIALIG